MSKKKGPKGKAVSRLTLRLPPEDHARIALVARNLNVTVNALGNYLITRFLGQLELEAKVYQWFRGGDTDDQFEEMRAWLLANPGKSPRQYVFHLMEELMSEPFNPQPSDLPDLASLRASGTTLPCSPPEEDDDDDYDHDDDE